MVKTALKYTYLGGKTHTELKNEVSTCRKMYYDREIRVMVNQSVNAFYTQFLFKIDALPQYVVLPLDISEIFFKNLSLDVREFLIWEGVQVPPRKPTEKYHQGNKSIPLVLNAAVEEERKIITIKVGVQPEIVSLHPSTFIGIIGGNPSTQMAGLGIIFQYE